MTRDIRINGEMTSVADGMTVAELVAERGAGGSIPRGSRGVAVAVNGEVVPRSEWDATELDAEDVVEILNAVGGG
ncbi:MAG: sulfur carrier protein ThiS [Actinobacteria bacterium]|nr:sulfur carrier protein ThiS [Actinomycetota bacterium]